MVESHITKDNWLTFMVHAEYKYSIVNNTKVSQENNDQFPFAFEVKSWLYVLGNFTELHAHTGTLAQGHLHQTSVLQKKLQKKKSALG